MWRKGIVLAGMLALLAAAATAASGAVTSATVAPRPGIPSTAFKVSFRAPDATGVTGSLERYYVVHGSTTAQSACTASFSVRPPAVAAGEMERVRLGPGRSRHWCIGVFHGRIDEFSQPVCPPGKLCPLFVSQVREIAAFSFRVNRSANRHQAHH